jgi:hypothetical protein
MGWPWSSRSRLLRHRVDLCHFSEPTCISQPCRLLLVSRCQCLGSTPTKGTPQRVLARGKWSIQLDSARPNMDLRRRDPRSLRVVDKTASNLNIGLRDVDCLPLTHLPYSDPRYTVLRSWLDLEHRWQPSYRTTNPSLQQVPQQQRQEILKILQSHE